MDKKLYGKSSCSALQFSAGLNDDDSIYIAREVIDKVYPSMKGSYKEINKVSRADHAKLIDNIEGRGIFARDRAKVRIFRPDLLAY